MTTMEDVLNDHRVPFLTEGRHTRPGWLQMTCPWCGGDPYLGYSIAWDRWNCWRCGPLSGSKVLQALTNLPWHQIKQLVGGIEREYHHQERPRGKLQLPTGIEPLRNVHRNYLLGRGFDPDEVTVTWGVQALGCMSKLGWRLFIPITYQGETVSWTTRSLDDNAPDRYRSASPQEESVPHKELLAGEDYVGSTIIVHEGPFDVFRTGPGSVWTSGTSFSPAQVLRIARYPKRVTAFDNEPEAQRRARDLCRRLAAYPGETVNVVLGAKDAGEASDDEIHQLRGMLK